MSDLNPVNSVLFCCSQNSLRSPMAEGILKHLSKNRLFADSCGVSTGTTDRFMISVMAEKGIDMSGHTPKQFKDIHDFSFDIIIALSSDAQILASKFTKNIACEVELWEIDDPSNIESQRKDVINAYRATRDKIFNKICERFNIKNEL